MNSNALPRQLISVLEEARLTPTVHQCQVKELHEQSTWQTGHFIRISNLVQANLGKSNQLSRLWFSCRDVNLE